MLEDLFVAINIKPQTSGSRCEVTAASEQCAQRKLFIRTSGGRFPRSDMCQVFIASFERASSSQSRPESLRNHQDSNPALQRVSTCSNRHKLMRNVETCLTYKREVLRRVNHFAQGLCLGETNKSYTLESYAVFATRHL